MTTIQVVLDEQLLREADRVAKDCRLNRSALIREALAEHLKARALKSREIADQQGYKRIPAEANTDLANWEEESVWPEI